MVVGRGDFRPSSGRPPHPPSEPGGVAGGVSGGVSGGGAGEAAKRAPGALGTRRAGGMPARPSESALTGPAAAVSGPGAAPGVVRAPVAGSGLRGRRRGDHGGDHGGARRGARRVAGRGAGRPGGGRRRGSGRRGRREPRRTVADGAVARGVDPSPGRRQVGARQSPDPVSRRGCTHGRRQEAGRAGRRERHGPFVPGACAPTGTPRLPPPSGERNARRPGSIRSGPSSLRS